jgi:DNA-binding NarL/FixJ family response regulator
MINVVIIGSNIEAEKQLLAQHNDMNVSFVHPSTIEVTVSQVGLFQPDIFILKNDEENINVDMLCHFLSKSYPDAHSLFLTLESPTFEMLQDSGFKARGYVTPEQQQKLAKAVRVIHDGEAWLPRTLVAEMLNRFSAAFYKTVAA